MSTLIGETNKLLSASGALREVTSAISVGKAATSADFVLNASARGATAALRIAHSAATIQAIATVGAGGLLLFAATAIGALWKLHPGFSALQRGRKRILGFLMLRGSRRLPLPSSAP
jgi:hypothetical protein